VPKIPIPIRFENILASPALEPTSLIVPVEDDLQYFEQLRRRADVQGSGVLAVPGGDSGAGKTTAVYAASALMPDRFEPVVAVPPTVPLRDVMVWLTEHLAVAQRRATLVLLDGREASDDKIGLKQLMSGLNQLVRGRPDLIVCWPTVDDEWRDDVYGLAQTIGGGGLAPEGFEALRGPDSSMWMDVLDRILIQLDHTRDDLALDDAFIQAAAAEETNIGRFLLRISTAIAARVDQVQLSKRLPKVVFVVTSISEVVGEANRLRRAGSYLLKPHELLGYSPRSEAGKWWAARARVPEHHLGYVIALFQATLTTMTPSSVVYSCAEYGDAPLRALPREAGVGRSASNAERTFKTTDFYRLLIGEPSRELTSTMKGRTAESTLRAHALIQASSSKRHKAINQAICGLAETVVPEFRASLGNFEVDLGEQNLYTDAVVPLGSDDLYLEFHHLSGAHCRPASIASYVMEKLRGYAIHHNIVPR